jgi:Flp pilus assembly protein TadG
MRLAVSFHLRGFKRPHSRRERGATLVETALVFSIVLLPALLGIMGFGHALYAYHFVSHASKTAARWAAVNGYNCKSDGSCTYTTGAADTDIETYATNMLPPGMDSANVLANATWPLQTGGPQVCSADITDPSTGAVLQTKEANFAGCTVEVTVSYSYKFIFPFLPVNSSITAPCQKAGWCLQSTSDMVIIH